MFEANCTLCNRNFGIGHGGRNDLTIHSKSDLHKGNVNAARSSSVLSYFVKSTTTGLDKQVSCTQDSRSLISGHLKNVGLNKIKLNSITKLQLHYLFCLVN